MQAASRRSSAAPSHASSAHSKNVPKGKANGHNGHRKAARRGTLDEELLAAGDDPQPDFDSGILVGVGTKSKKKGFLAHGGAGGVPVFMGEGYVDGVEGSNSEEDAGGEEDEEMEDDDEYVPQGRSRGRTSRR
jgi:hypothetical protein